MKRFCVFLALAMILVAGGVSAHADTVINFASSGSNGVTFTQTTGGQYITFSNLYVNSGSIGGDGESGDSSMNAPVTISPGAGGHFYLDGVSTVDGATVGDIQSNSAATLTIGNASSGILTGSLNMIQIETTSSSGHGASFSIVLTLTNMTYTCGVGCTNSTLLSTFAQTGNGSSNSYNAITFTLTGGGITNATTLLNHSGTVGTSLAGSLDSFYDTVTPEPASLALFGSCLLLVGRKLHRCVAKS